MTLHFLWDFFRRREMIGWSVVACSAFFVFHANWSFAQAPTIGETPHGSDLVRESTETSQLSSGQIEPDAQENGDDNVPDEDVPKPPTPEELEQAIAASGPAANPDGSTTPGSSPSESASGIDSSVISVDKFNIPPDDATKDSEVEPKPTPPTPSATTSAVAARPSSGTKSQRRPYLGLVAGSRSATVTKVRDRTAASLAGFAVGDVLVQVNDTPVESFEQFLQVIARHLPGDAIDVVVRRDERPQKLFVILGVKSPAG